MTIHPKLNDCDYRPDFLIENQFGESFYLEAVISTGISSKEAAQKANLNEFNDNINKLNTDNYFLKVNMKNLPSKPIPTKKIRVFLENELNNLDPNVSLQNLNPVLTS